MRGQPNAARPAVSAGGFIYVSGTVPPDSGAGAGEQTRRVLERIGEILAAEGTSLGRVIAVTVYLRSPADFPAMNDAYAAFWPKEPPTRTTVVADLADEAALVEMSVVAAGFGVERSIVHPTHWIRSPNPYSYAIRSGDTLFLSGLVSRNGRDNSVVSGDVGAQTRVVLDNAGELLTTAGLDYSNVVSTRVFLPDRSAFDQMNAVYRTYFPSSPPARATVPARLAGPHFVVEMTMIASSAKGETTNEGMGLRLPLSGAVRAGDRVYLSGILGMTASNAHDAASQTRETLATVGSTLEAAGSSAAAVVDATVFLSDLGQYDNVMGAYNRFFESARPACTVVATGLVPANGLIEIMVTSVDR